MFICSIFHFISSDISIPPKTMISIKDNISTTPEFPRIVRLTQPYGLNRKCAS